MHDLLSLILALLLVVLCRMFSHHVCLEPIGSAALVVAVSTGKRLLTSVRPHVLFYIASCNAREVALVTLKRLLSRMSEHVSVEGGSI